MIMKSKRDMTPDYYRDSENNSTCWIDAENVCKTKPSIEHNADILKFLVYVLSILLRFLLRILRTAITTDHTYVKMQGAERFSKEFICIAYIGDKKSFHYINDLLFLNIPEITEEKTFRWWQLNQIVQNYESSVDLVVIDVSFPVTLWVKCSGFLVVPRWIMQRVDIANTWADVMGRLRRKTRREAQRVIRKYNYHARVIEGQLWAEDFYEQLYQPHIEKRYGDAAVVVSREQFTKECSRGKIIQLVHNEKVISAALLLHAGRHLSIEWTGMIPDLHKNLKLGATDALDYFTLLYAYLQGYDFLDMGPSRASLNDGLLRYKSKWGAVVYRKKIPQGRLMIKPVHSIDAVSSAITNHKFLSLEEGRLVSRVLLKGDMDQDTIEQVITNEWVEGLNRLSVFLQSDGLSVSTHIHPQVKIVTHKSLCQLYYLFKNSFGSYKIQDH